VRNLFSALGLDPEAVLNWFGAFAYFGFLAIVFAESGIMIGFFLPGDSLLFVAGFFSYLGSQPDANAIMPNIALVSLGAFVAAVAGDQVGYMFGRRVGPSLFRRPDSKVFKQKYLVSAEEFFERHGSKTIIIARFVPIVRTFAPIVAGAGKMRYRTFVSYNVIGGFVWAVGLTQAGYWLGKTFPSLGESIDKVVIVIVLVSLLPIGIEFLRHRRKKRKAEQEAEEIGGPTPAAVLADDFIAASDREPDSVND
jgi:membrane-associated protein